ncbi:MAG: hypothetical protein ABGX04_11570 [Myxococcales bacterium]
MAWFEANLDRDSNTKLEGESDGLAHREFDAEVDDGIVDGTVAPGKTNSVDLSEISAPRTVEKADSVISPPSKRHRHHTATGREGPPIHRPEMLVRVFGGPILGDQRTTVRHRGEA